MGEKKPKDGGSIARNGGGDLGDENQCAPPLVQRRRDVSRGDDRVPVLLQSPGTVHVRGEKDLERCAVGDLRVELAGRSRTDQHAVLRRRFEIPRQLVQRTDEVRRHGDTHFIGAARSERLRQLDQVSVVVA